MSKEAKIKKKYINFVLFHEPLFLYFCKFFQYKKLKTNQRNEKKNNL